MEAAVAGLKQIRETEMIGDDGVQDLTVDIKTTTSHQVPFIKLKAWLESSGRSPREAALKSKTEMIGRKIRVGVTEWNTSAGDWGPGRAKLWTLENALACSRYHNLMHRNADLIEIANRSNLTNSFCSGN